MTSDPTSPEPRLLTVTRQSRLSRGSAGPSGRLLRGSAGPSGRLLRSSAVAGALLVLPGLACGNNDAEAFATGGTDSSTVGSTASTTSSTSTTASSTSEATTSTTQVTTTLSGDQATTTVSDSTTAVAGGAAFPAGAELAVSFTFEPTSSRGPARNPYVAVWVEDADGNLVDTISLWYGGGRGGRWLNELRSWYTASDASADSAVVGATRAAGTYTVVWDGTDLAGNPVPQGQYVVYVEAAREHGPYELTGADIAIGDSPVTVTMDDQGELSNVSAELML